MASVARASYRCFVSWVAYNLGAFTIGFSQIGGTDLLGTSPADLSFTGPYDDVSPKLSRVTFNRGRDDGLSIVGAGEATVDLRDPDGRFNPSNPASPLAGVLDDRLHPIMLQGVIGSPLTVAFPLFYGWVRRLVWEPQGRKGTAQLECVDLFYRLARAFPVIASTGPTTTGAAIGKILDAVGLPDPAARSLDVGDSILDFAADGSKSALDLIGDLLEAERGIFFVAGDGQATYRSRLTRQTGAVVGAIANSMRAIGPGSDFDQARTRVTVTRTQSGYTAVKTAPSLITGRLGLIDLPAIATPFLLNDGQADSLASWLLSQVATTRQPIYGLTIDNREQALLDQILAREIGDRITVTEAEGGTTGTFVIERLAHDVDVNRGRHSAAYLLTKADTATPFRIGSSLIGGTDVLVY
jgi:hypothetical protein